MFSAWGTFDLGESSKILQLNYGTLQIWAKMVANEVWLASQEHPNEEVTEARQSISPIESSWSRWAISDFKKAIAVTPCFPSRSIVVKPEYPFHLMANADAKIYVRVPASVRITAVAQPDTILTEIPAYVLSNTWFGDFQSGELCYWLSTSARRYPVLDDKKLHLITCPIYIKNTSMEELFVEKLRLQVRTLNIYEGNGRLWSNETRISYRGGAQVSDVNVASGSPSEVDQATLQTRAREPFKKGFAASTFGRWANIASFGLFED